MALIPSVRLGELVEVRWRDANTPEGGGWESGLSARLSDPTLDIATAGYWLGKRGGYVMVCGDISRSEAHDLVGRQMNIPIGCVLGIRRLGGRRGEWGE